VGNVHLSIRNKCLHKEKKYYSLISNCNKYYILINSQVYNTLVS
jgi:chitinase